MKKLVFFQALLIAVVMLVSCSSTSSDFINAYEEATEELKTATSNEDCDRIHDKLMHRLYEITQSDENWEEALAGEEDVKNAYEAWGEALKKATTNDHWFYMPICTPGNAIEYCEKMR